MNSDHSIMFRRRKVAISEQLVHPGVKVIETELDEFGISDRLRRMGFSYVEMIDKDDTAYVKLVVNRFVDVEQTASEVEGELNAALAQRAEEARTDREFMRMLGSGGLTPGFGGRSALGPL